MTSLVNVRYNTSDNEMKQNVVSISYKKEKLYFTIDEQEKPIDVISDEKYSNFVVLKKKAFSMNYRDINIVVSNRLEKNNEKLFFGSDFVAKVIAKGKNVEEIELGDIVINNNNYPFVNESGSIPGIPSNLASKKYEVIHKEKIIKIPDNMTIEKAAAFSIGAQTAYSMIRKLKIKDGDNILVTAVNSNTSKFIINVLSKYNVNIYGISSQPSKDLNLVTPNVREIFTWDYKKNQFLDKDYFLNVYKIVGGLDIVIDPFFDTFFVPTIPLLNQFGKYITCGLFKQNSLLETSLMLDSETFSSLLQIIMLKNITIIGNCLGTTEDLEIALTDYKDNNFDVPIDSIYDKTNLKEFLEKSFNIKPKFGKVIFKYD